MKINFNPLINFKNNLQSGKNLTIQIADNTEKSGNSDLSNIYYSPLSFGCKDCDDNVFKQELKELRGIHCPITGVKMLTEKEHKKLLNDAKSITKASDLIGLLGKNEDSLLPVYKNMYKYSKEVVSRNPDMNSQELINILRAGTTKRVRNTLNFVKLKLRENQRDESLSSNDREKIRECRHRIGDLADDPELRILSFKKYKNILQETIGKLDSDTKWDIYDKSKNAVKEISLYQHSLIFNPQDYYDGKTQTETLVEKIFSGSVSEIGKFIIGSDDKLNHRDANQILVCRVENDKVKYLSAKLFEQEDAKAKLELYISETSNAILNNEIQSNKMYPSILFGFIKKINGNMKLERPDALIKLGSVNHAARLKSNDFDIVNHEGIPCARCGNTAITHEQKCKIFEELENAKDLFEIRDIMQQNSKYLKPKYKEVLNNYTKLLEKTPYISDTELLSELRAIYHEKTNKQVLNMVTKVQKLLKSPDISAKDRELAKEFLNETKKNFVNYHACKSFPYEDYSKLVTDTLQQISAQKREELSNDLRRSVCKAHIVECNLYPHKNALAKSDMPIKIVMQNVMKTATATASNLDPLYKVGARERKNLVVYCSDCNGEKSNHEYKNSYKTYPGQKKNFDKYLDKVDELIDSGEIQGYEDYPDEVADYAHSLLKDI